MTPRHVWIAAVALGVLALALRWPGVAMYDSIAQYEQASSGRYVDWHPPIMARLWSLLLPLHEGTQPMLVLQMLAWWGGFGLIAAALARGGRGIAAAGVLAVAACPLWLGWATVVLKDSQMAGALVLATGLVAHWRLAERALPRWTIAACTVLIGYATLVRGNAVFATVPYAFALGGWAGVRPVWLRGVVLLAAMGAVVLLGPVFNQHVLGAERSGVERALQLYDLTGIAVHAPLETLPGITPEQWREARRRDCYTPYFWNPFGEGTQCDFVGRKAAFDPGPGDHINRTWVAAILAHPLAYAEHRLVHLNSNLRLIVGKRDPDAIPPVDSEPNDYGLGARASKGGIALITAAGWLIWTPLAWPCVWLVASFGLLWASWGVATPAARLGRALAFSAAMLSASFAVVSIASDLRYHLWSMIAAALAAILLIDARAIRRKRVVPLVAAVVAVILVAGVARQVAPRQHIPRPAISLPPGPDAH